MHGLLKIRGRDGQIAPFMLNRVQLELDRDPSPRKVVLKARQMGLTTWVAARFFVKTITRPGTLTVEVAHDQESAEEIFKIVHRFQENLPEALRLNDAGVRELAPLRTSRSNVRQIVFPELDSEYRVESAADPNAGRGYTIQNLHCSEIARWPGDAAAALAALRAAVPGDGEIILESTPNGAGGCFYDEWQHGAEAGSSRHFFPWWWEPSYGISVSDVFSLSAEEAELASRHNLGRSQIAWRRKAQSNLRKLSPQEFAEDAVACFLASGECVFDLEIIGSGLEFCAGQFWESRENGALRLWYPPASGRHYIIGVDPAGGGSTGDYACAQIIDRSTGLQCAELQAHFSPAELAHRIADLAREYNGALLVVERNNHGHAVLAHLSAGASGLFIYEEHGQAGWLTTASNRPQMVETFAATLAMTPRLFSSQRLLEECRTFIRKASGVPSAAAGTHDDCVMAMAIALAARAATAGQADGREPYATALVC